MDCTRNCNEIEQPAVRSLLLVNVAQRRSASYALYMYTQHNVTARKVHSFGIQALTSVHITIFLYDKSTQPRAYNSMVNHHRLLGGMADDGVSQQKHTMSFEVAHLLIKRNMKRICLSVYSIMGANENISLPLPRGEAAADICIRDVCVT
jgi:hypothetical protein